MIGREKNLLNALKSDVTKTVTRKPDNAEGNNGDFAVGNTPEGSMIFMKVKNKWHSMKPRTATGNNPSTFKGSIDLMNLYVNTGQYGQHNSWIPMYDTWHHWNRFNEQVFDSSWDVTSHNWRDMYNLPYLIPESCTIDFIHSTHSPLEQGDAFVETTSTLRIFELRSGDGDWDDDDTIITNDAHTLTDTAEVNIPAHYTKFEYPINSEHVYLKGSHIALYIENKKKADGSDSDFLNQNFILQFTPKEKILEEER